MDPDNRVIAGGAVAVESDSSKLPKLDLQLGSAVFLDMGVRGSSGYYISVISAVKNDTELYLHLLLLSPGEDCWETAQSTRPLKLLYFDEKIESLTTKYSSTAAPPCE